MLQIAIIVPSFCAAFFYVVAAYIMKSGGNLPLAIILSTVLVTLGAAAWFEIVALRSGRFGNIFIVILAFEVLLTAFCAFLVLGEVYSRREIFGLLVILAGIGITSWQGLGEAPAAGEDAERHLASSQDGP